MEGVSISRELTAAAECERVSEAAESRPVPAVSGRVSIDMLDVKTSCDRILSKADATSVRGAAVRETVAKPAHEAGSISAHGAGARVWLGWSGEAAAWSLEGEVTLKSRGPDSEGERLWKLATRWKLRVASLIAVSW